jgi:hypothetical protein
MPISMQHLQVIADVLGDYGDLGVAVLKELLPDRKQRTTTDVIVERAMAQALASRASTEPPRTPPATPLAVYRDDDGAWRVASFERRFDSQEQAAAVAEVMHRLADRAKAG